MTEHMEYDRCTDIERALGLRVSALSRRPTVCAYVTRPLASSPCWMAKDLSHWGFRVLKEYLPD